MHVQLGRMFVGNMQLLLEPVAVLADMDGWEDGWMCAKCVSANQKLCAKAATETTEDMDTSQATQVGWLFARLLSRFYSCRHMQRRPTVK